MQAKHDSKSDLFDPLDLSNAVVVSSPRKLGGVSAIDAGGKRWVALNPFALDWVELCVVDEVRKECKLGMAALKRGDVERVREAFEWIAGFKASVMEFLNDLRGVAKGGRKRRGRKKAKG